MTDDTEAAIRRLPAQAHRWKLPAGLSEDELLWGYAGKGEAEEADTGQPGPSEAPEIGGGEADA